MRRASEERLVAPAAGVGGAHEFIMLPDTQEEGIEVIEEGGLSILCGPIYIWCTAETWAL